MDFLVPPFLDYLPSKDWGVSPPPTFELWQLMLILILLLMLMLVWRFMLMSMLILMVLIVKFQCFFSNDVIANAFEEIYFLSSYNHWEIYCVSLQVHLEKYISCHPMHLCIVKEERRRLGWTNNWILAQMHFVTNIWTKIVHHNNKNKRLASHEYSLYQTKLKLKKELGFLQIWYKIALFWW